MSRIVAPFFALALLAACAPLNIWYKPGATVAASEEQLLNCRAQAARDIPVNTRTRITPVTIIPRQICDGDGNCQIYHERIGGEVIVYDANAGLRDEVVQQCMRKRGFSPATIPPCPDSLRQSAPAGRTTVMPRLTENACVIRNRDGTWQIVNRAG
ncbi:hypothetical protein M8756_01425 [Lutimaribacter sp. EGI FJ00015]|uniref:Uncharacterized protein n=1 Tax=Lutimaribacter degradans TaxID=2945989 RepID=A0ACC5ZU65_9RHOB|nr:hypothetical protein [Lutimaribacter sp. EGI FJ00013]MCM2561099.1 hypothetical protein [Lutimaribacter sp. EGI FJ00013]MCO0611952.1 hypothetical protein [Lutimaribacter sp. EGI FJ00015]MCO0634927.1 hypothetical protein [Lutimaribacter sp. EGI FJ00014]